MVDLNCGVCGAKVGYADSEDNYKEHYLYVDDNGEWDCKNCNLNNAVVVDKWIFRITIGLFIMIPIIMYVLNEFGLLLK